MKGWVSQNPAAQGAEGGGPFPSLPTLTGAGNPPHQCSWTIAWASPEASELRESFSLACGYRNYCSLNGQSFAKSQNKYLHLRCHYESQTIHAQGTPPAFTLFSFSAGLWSIAKAPSAARTLSGAWAPGDAARAVARVRARLCSGPNQCQRQAEHHYPASLSAEPAWKPSPAGRRFSAAPVLLPNGNSGSSTPFFGTTFSLFCFLLSPARFLLQLSKMPTSSCRLTMPGWQLTTSEPSKSNASKSSYEKGGKASLSQASLCFLQLKMLHQVTAH